MITAVKTLPPHPNLQQYKKQAKDLLAGWRSAEAEAVQRVGRFHPRFGTLRGSESQPEAQSQPAFVLADAQLVLAREHGFESWPRLARHIQMLRRAGSLVPAFELAADAVVSGDVAMLAQLLRDHPGLIRARSSRAHHGTLLHYVGANGLEDFRQKTPGNAVAVLRILLEAGAEVDAQADMYNHDTTLGLVATSVHPLRAGVQQALMETLLAAGAAVDPGGSIVNACLANGRGQAARFLASRGASLDLEGAAGVGRLDVVRACFDQNGSLRSGATRTQMQSGLNWACEYGETGVVEFLLEKGADPGVPDHHGQTAPHWAVIGGQLHTLKILLKRKAPLETMNSYGGTVLGQAVWSALHDGAGADYVPIIEALLAAGASLAAAGQLPTGNPRIDEALRRRGSAT
jgi:Ankyrin repeats (3 copies)